MVNGKRIVDHLVDLYSISDKAAEKMYTHTDKLEEALAPYDETRVIDAINEYWKFKDNKAYPRIAHILAMIPRGAERRYDDKEKPSSIPNDLADDYEKAIEWLNLIQNPSFWNKEDAVVLSCDIEYAIKQAISSARAQKQDVWYQYGADTKRSPHALNITLFYKFSNDPVADVLKHLNFKRTSGGDYGAVKQVLKSSRM